MKVLTPLPCGERGVKGETLMEFEAKPHALFFVINQIFEIFQKTMRQKINKVNLIS